MADKKKVTNLSELLQSCSSKYDKKIMERRTFTAKCKELRTSSNSMDALKSLYQAMPPKERKSADDDAQEVGHSLPSSSNARSSKPRRSSKRFTLSTPLVGSLRPQRVEEMNEGAEEFGSMPMSQSFDDDGDDEVDMEIGDDVENDDDMVDLSLDTGSNCTVNESTIKSKKEKQKVNTTIHYAFELRKNNSIVCCSKDFTHFCIRDFDMEQRILMDKKFHFIRRKPHCFIEEDWHWIMKCSCSAKEQNFLETLTTRIPATFSEFESLLPTCYHIDAMMMALEMLDTQNCITPYDVYAAVPPGKTNKFDSDANTIMYDVPGGDPMVCIFNEERNSFGVLGCRSGKLFCFSCFTSSCCHEELFSAYDGKEDLPPLASLLLESIGGNCGTAKCTYQPVSWRPIDFLHFSTSETYWPKKSDFDHIKSRQEMGMLELFPKVDTLCKHCGSSCLKDNPKEMGWVAVPFAHTYLQADILMTRVYHRICSNADCKSIISYDGSEDNILNMGSFLVSHALLRNFMYHFLHGRMPMFTYYTVIVEESVDTGMDVLMEAFNYNKFRNSWYAYLKLLKIEYESGFRCNICGDSPPIMMCDGTTLAFRKEKATCQALHDIDDENVQKIKRTSKYSDRVYVSNPRARKLLRRYAAGGQGEAKLLSLEEYDDMMKILSEENNELHTLIISVIQDPGNDNPMMKTVKNEAASLVYCSPTWAPFFKALAMDSAVCGLLHPEESLLDVVRNLPYDIPVDQGSLEVLQKKFPLMFRLITKMPEFTLREEFNAVLNKMVEKSLAPFSQQDEMIEDVMVEKVEPTAYWPALSFKRNRGNYQADKSRKGGKSSKICTKYTKGHSFLLPGIFTAFCEHDCCYGFEVMLNCESPNVPFNIFFTRFASAPKICIYDNACNLQDYCLNRQPNFFRGCKFLVDQLHWPGHVGCSEGYSLSEYPDLRHLNDQINEQSNSCLKRIKPQLSYMTEENFMAHCRFYVWYRNQKKLQKAKNPNRIGLKRR